MESRDARIAENESLFREMNERLAAWEERQAAPATTRHMFFCECANRVCHDRVCLSIPEYEAVRESPVRFAVLPDHVRPDIERVVGEGQGYVVVEKDERVRYILEQSDPRRTATPDGGRAKPR